MKKALLSLFVAGILAGSAQAQNLRQNLFPTLNFQNAITEIRGSGAQQIAIFADPNGCPDCTQLMQKLQNLPDITIHTFLYVPTATEKNRELLNKAKAIWCNSDPVGVWNNLVLRRVEPPALPKEREQTCDIFALWANQNFGALNKINRVPTSFLPNGKRLTGVLTDEGIKNNLTPQAPKKIPPTRRFNFN